MTFKQTMASLFSTAEGTYYKWKKEQRPIIDLLEKYFSKEDLEEFLESGKIKKFDKINISEELFKNYRESYFSYIRNKMMHISNMNENLLKYYFEYLFYLKSRINQFEIHKNPFNAAAISFALTYDRELNQNQINDFHVLIDIIDFLDDTDGMWFYFKYLLKDDLDDFIEDIDINPYLKNEKISIGDIYTTIGVDHYYMYHCYNNISPYSIKDME